MLCFVAWPLEDKVADKVADKVTTLLAVELYVVTKKFHSVSSNHISRAKPSMD